MFINVTPFPACSSSDKSLCYGSLGHPVPLQCHCHEIRHYRQQVNPVHRSPQEIPLAGTRNQPDDELDGEVGHVDGLDYHKGCKLAVNLTLVLFKVGKCVEGEDDGGDEDAADGDDPDYSREKRGVRMLKQVPEPSLKLVCTFLPLLLLHLHLGLLPLHLLTALNPLFEAARLKAGFRQAPVGEVSHKSHRATVIGYMEGSATVVVEDVDHVAVTVIEEHFVVGSVVTITVIQELVAPGAAGKVGQPGVWHLKHQTPRHVEHLPPNIQLHSGAARPPVLEG